MLEEVLLLLQPVDESEFALPNAGPDELHALQNICLRLLAAERFGAPRPGSREQFARMARTSVDYVPAPSSMSLAA